MNDKYLEEARRVVNDNWILINAASDRAAELSRGSRPLVPLSPGQQIDYLDLALREIAEGKIVVRKRVAAEA